MSNIDKQRIAAVRTLQARLDAESKAIADARRYVGTMQGGGPGIAWRPIE
jgi:hypothetical protein